MGGSESKISWITVTDGHLRTETKLHDRFSKGGSESTSRMLIADSVIGFTSKSGYRRSTVTLRVTRLRKKGVVPIVITRVTHPVVGRSLARRWVRSRIDGVIVVDPTAEVGYSTVAAFLKVQFLVADRLTDLRPSDDDPPITRIGCSEDPESPIARLTTSEPESVTPSRFGGARKRRRLLESPRGELNDLIRRNRLQLVDRWREVTKLL